VKFAVKEKGRTFINVVAAETAVAAE
jgi:hypothetical protein